MIHVLLEAGTPCAEGAPLPLPDDEAHHLHVRRVAAGEAVALLDGEGLEARGTLRWDGKRAVVDVREVRHLPPPPATVLGVGAGDRERLAFVAEKAAELGVTDLVPLETAHARAVATRLRVEQVDRLGRRAREATKQCGNPWAPRVHRLQPLETWLAGPLPPLRWLADGAGTPPAAELGAEAVAVAVGPEGGFAATERGALLVAGFLPVALGPHILRLETAALAAAAAVLTARARGLR